MNVNVYAFFEIGTKKIICSSNMYEYIKNGTDSKKDIYLNKMCLSKIIDEIGSIDILKDDCLPSNTIVTSIVIKEFIDYGYSKTLNEKAEKIKNFIKSIYEMKKD